MLCIYLLTVWYRLSYHQILLWIFYGRYNIFYMVAYHIPPSDATHCFPVLYKCKSPGKWCYNECRSHMQKTCVFVVKWCLFYMKNGCHLFVWRDSPYLHVRGEWRGWYFKCKSHHLVVFKRSVLVFLQTKWWKSRCALIREKNVHPNDISRKDYTMLTEL